MFDLISIGDAVVDTNIAISHAKLLEDDGEKFLAFCLGNKVPVGESQSMIGGNAANNAVGAARLGLRVAHWVHVGNDSEKT